MRSERVFVFYAIQNNYDTNNATQEKEPPFHYDTSRTTYNSSFKYVHTRSLMVVCTHLAPLATQLFLLKSLDIPQLRVRYP